MNGDNTDMVHFQDVFSLSQCKEIAIPLEAIAAGLQTLQHTMPQHRRSTRRQQQHTEASDPETTDPALGVQKLLVLIDSIKTRVAAQSLLYLSSQDVLDPEGSECGCAISAAQGLSPGHIGVESRGKQTEIRSPAFPPVSPQDFGPSAIKPSGINFSPLVFPCHCIDV